MNYRRIVPNSISGLSLVFGIISIFNAFEGNFFRASILIILAVCADACDGRAARLLHCQAEFGVQLDSLCDLASFGVAPAVLIYQYSLHELGLVGQVVAALYAFWGAMRLARFNVNTSVVHGYFQGMPIPAGACFLATYVLSGLQFPSLAVAVMTFVLGIILYSTVKFPDCKGKGNPLGPIKPVALVGGLLLGGYIVYLDFNAWPFALMAVYSGTGIVNFLLGMFVE
ncbi:MAG: CDP-diacylglycerol--serine O-phosphatidyltransferase [Acidaminococcaceae bacterium]|nr:CDP-diacylglycerol--serine O-phosphatidyltransferase [Acidaminococcaceae bacterium]